MIIFPLLGVWAAPNNKKYPKIIQDDQQISKRNVKRPTHFQPWPHGHDQKWSKNVDPPQMFEGVL